MHMYFTILRLLTQFRIHVEQNKVDLRQFNTAFNRLSDVYLYYVNIRQTCGTEKSGLKRVLDSENTFMLVE